MGPPKGGSPMADETGQPGLPEAMRGMAAPGTAGSGEQQAGGRTAGRGANGRPGATAQGSTTAAEPS